MHSVKETAIDAALSAGKLLKERLGNIRQIDYKSVANIVTDVDKASEVLICQAIRDRFPEDSILAEEGSVKETKAPRRWLIDPLDGTTNFAHTYPFFAVSIALEEAGILQFGCVYNPIADEMFWAEKGKGAWLKDSPLKVSSVRNLSESLLATGFPAGKRELAESNFPEFASITAVCHGVRRDGSAALDLCFVAAGRFEGFWETKLAPWDMAAGALIVAEAGGNVTNYAGGPLDLSSGLIIATNGHVHNDLQEHLQVFQKAHSKSALA